MCWLSKEQSILYRETIQNAFFYLELCPFLDLDFFSTIKHPHSRVLPAACGALVKKKNMVVVRALVFQKAYSDFVFTLTNTNFFILAFSHVPICYQQNGSFSLDFWKILSVTCFNVCLRFHLKSLFLFLSYLQKSVMQFRISRTILVFSHLSRCCLQKSELRCRSCTLLFIFWCYTGSSHSYQCTMCRWVLNDCFNPFLNIFFFIFPKWKNLQMTVLNLINMAESSPNLWKML